MQKLSLIVILLNFLSSCSNPTQEAPIILSDTAKILKLAIQEGISVRSMPSASELTRNSPLGDTILITSESIPFSYFPSSIDSFYFKPISYKDICQTIALYPKTNDRLHYLNLLKFEKNDSEYIVHMECLNDCNFWSTGGVLGVWFKAVKDSFIIADKSAASIN